MIRAAKNAELEEESRGSTLGKRKQLLEINASVMADAPERSAE
jgi:hypothetical protein